jgi:hypothetical protein
MMRYIRVGVLVMAVGFFSAGCGKASLQNDKDVGVFLGDLAKGKGADGWRLGDHPSVPASLVWEHSQSTGDLGEKLHEHGREWGCNAAQAVEVATRL